MIKLALAKTLHVMSYSVWMSLPFMVMFMWACVATYYFWEILKHATALVCYRCKDLQEKILLWYLKSS